MKLTTNLATRRYINLRQLNLALEAGFLICGVVAVFKVGEITHNASEISRIGELTRGISTRGGGPQVGEAQLKAQAARIHFANQVITRKSVNWVNLLDRLEEVVPTGVALTQIEPDPDQSVKISGMTHSFAGVRGLMENMERSKNFSEVYLLSQSEAKVGLTQEGTHFTVRCKVVLR